MCVFFEFPVEFPVIISSAYSIKIQRISLRIALYRCNRRLGQHRQFRKTSAVYERKNIATPRGIRSLQLALTSRVFSKLFAWTVWGHIIKFNGLE